MKNERWLELSLFADRRNNQPVHVTFVLLMTERNNMIRKHPKTRFVLAHFGWHANDLQRLVKLLDEFPNVTVEAGAVLYDFGRQPRASHDFFVKYQDRILFGKDSYQPNEFPYYWRVFETADEYFDYYRDTTPSEDGRMSLPDEVLKRCIKERGPHLQRDTGDRLAAVEPKVQGFQTVPEVPKASFCCGSIGSNHWNADRTMPLEPVGTYGTPGTYLQTKFASSSMEPVPL
jgi:hypothetical protein